MTFLTLGFQQAVKGNLANLNLDDIFSDVMFTPEGDTIFMSEEQASGDMLNSAEGRLTTMASKPTTDGRFNPVQKAGGLYTTHLHDPTQRSTTMGAAGAAPETAAVPFQHAPQAEHHLQYATSKKKKSSGDRKMSEQQKVERRYVCDAPMKASAASGFHLSNTFLFHQ